MQIWKETCTGVESGKPSIQVYTDVSYVRVMTHMIKSWLIWRSHDSYAEESYMTVYEGRYCLYETWLLHMGRRKSSRHELYIIVMSLLNSP